MTSLLIALLLSQSSVIVQQGRARDGGVAWPVSLSPGNPDFAQTVRIDDYSQTAFGAIRTATPYGLADLSMISSFDTADIYSVSLDGGSATYIPLQSSVVLQGPYAAVRTNDQYRYQAGRGLRFLMTTNIPTALDAGVYRWGFADDGDGILWQADSSGLKLIVRSSVADGGANETSYTLDAGTGWDPTKTNIWESRFQWLGSGEIESFINGTRMIRIQNANLLPYPYMRTAFLPLSWDVRSTGATNAQLKMTCSSVQSEAGEPNEVYTYAVSRTTDLTVGNGATDIPVLSLRAGATSPSGRSRVQTLPLKMACLSETKSIRVRVVLNPTAMPNASFAAANSAGATQYDVAATAVTGGTQVVAWAVPANGFYEQDVQHIFSEKRRRLRRRAFANPTTTGLEAGLDTVVILATNPGSGNATVNCSIEYGEIR